MTTFLRSKTVKIQKPRECFCCLRKFEARTEMLYTVCADAGEVHTSYSCLTCETIMAVLSEGEYDHGFVADMLENGETPEQLLKRLT